MAAQREFFAKNNIIINLDVNAPGAGPRLAQAMNFLARSRIQYALTQSPPLSRELLSQFWENISYDTSVNPPVIRTEVNAQQIAFSAATLRQVLQLGTEAQENGPPVFPDDFIAGALQRMGYVGPRRGQQYLKALVLGQWRYLFHVMVTVFGAKKGGFDELSKSLMSGLLSLVYNKPYSFSGYIFQAYVDQIRELTRSRFMLFPRFTMLIIRHFIPNLPGFQPTIRVDTLERRGLNACFQETRRAGVGQPVARPMFGAVLNANYVPPPNNGWEDAPAPAAPAAPAAAAAAPAAPAVADAPAAPVAPAAPAAVAPIPEPQAIIEDVLLQAAQHGGNVEVAAQVLNEVLVQNDAANDPDFQEIEAFHQEEEVPEDVVPEVVRPEGEHDQGPSVQSDVPSGPAAGDIIPSDSDDSDSEDLGPRGPPAGMRLVGKRLVVDPSLKGKQKRPRGDDDSDYTVEEEESLIRRRARARTTALTITPHPTPVTQTSPPVPPPPQAVVSVTRVSPVPPTTQEAREPVSETTQVPPQPSTSQDVSPTIEERLVALETKYLLLAAQHISIETAYNALMRSHEILLADAADKDRKIERLERIVASLLKGQPSQGEIMAYQMSCRDDTLRARREDDEGDDPNAPRESDMAGPSSRTKLTERTSTEGAAGASGSGSGVGPTDVGETFT